MAIARRNRDHWLSFAAVVILALMGFGILFQITQSIANSAEADTASFVSDPF